MSEYEKVEDISVGEVVDAIYGGVYFFTKIIDSYVVVTCYDIPQLKRDIDSGSMYLLRYILAFIFTSIHLQLYL